MAGVGVAPWLAWHVTIGQRVAECEDPLDWKTTQQLFRIPLAIFHAAARCWAQGRRRLRAARSFSHEWL